MKKQILFIWVCLFWRLVIVGQTPELPVNLKEKPKEEEKIFLFNGTHGLEFPDGEIAFRQWLLAHLRFETKIQYLIKSQKLTVLFILKPDGSVQKMVTKGDLSEKYKKDLIKTFKKLPRFKPTCSYCSGYPIWFRLDENLNYFLVSEKSAQ